MSHLALQHLTVVLVTLAALTVSLVALVRSASRDRPPPDPPQDVCLVMTDGRRIPVDCAYEGRKNGQHVWRMVTPVAGAVAAIHVGVLPPNTTVRGATQDLP